MRKSYVDPQRHLVTSLQAAFSPVRKEGGELTGAAGERLLRFAGAWHFTKPLSLPYFTRYLSRMPQNVIKSDGVWAPGELGSLCSLSQMGRGGQEDTAPQQCQTTEMHGGLGSHHRTCTVSPQGE